MTPTERKELDRATFMVFMKAALSWAIVIKTSHPLQQEAKWELNKLITGMQKLEKRLDDSIAKERQKGAQDLADNMGQFFELWIMADQEEQDAMVEFIRGLEAKKELKSEPENPGT